MGPWEGLDGVLYEDTSTVVQAIRAWGSRCYHHLEMGSLSVKQRTIWARLGIYHCRLVQVVQCFAIEGILHRSSSYQSRAFPAIYIPSN